MKILLTNDDGIHAKGINALFDALSTDHDVYLFAPHEEKSACSNALTIRTNINVDHVTDRKFTVYGYPSDCVNIALSAELVPEVDLIISGINHGPNLGDDIYYSGTVAGARSAFIHGKSAISVSLNSYFDLQYLSDAANFIKELIADGDIFRHDKTVFYNINYPAVDAEKVRGIKYTFLDKRHYTNFYRPLERETNRTLFQLQGEIDSAMKDGSDVKSVHEGYISVTPLTLDSTDYSILTKLKESRYE